MIVVDSTVWIDFFNGVATNGVERLRLLFGRRVILVGDLILCEILQGFRDERDAVTAQHALDAFAFAAMGGHDIALKAGENYRALRRQGITARKTIDMLIGTFCIENGHALLHADRDYDPLARHLGLLVH